MRRKVNLVGSSTLTVSIPKRWAAKLNLKKGKELEIAEQGNKLILSPETRKRIVLRLKDYDPGLIENLIVILYERGYEEVKVIFEKGSIFPLVKKAVGLLPSFEIMEQGSNYCTIRYVAARSDDHPEEIMAKMVKTISALSLLTLNDMEKGETGNWNRVEELDSTVQKFGALAFRISNEMYVSGYVFGLLLRLELISRSYYFMYKALKERKQRQNREVAEFLNETNKFFNTVFSRIDHDLGRLSSIKKESAMLYSRLYNLLEKAKGEEGIILLHIGEILKLASASVALVISRKYQENI